MTSALTFIESESFERAWKICKIILAVLAYLASLAYIALGAKACIASAYNYDHDTARALWIIFLAFGYILLINATWIILTLAVEKKGSLADKVPFSFSAYFLLTLMVASALLGLGLQKATSGYDAVGFGIMIGAVASWTLWHTIKAHLKLWNESLFA